MAAEIPDITLVHNNIGKGAKYAVEFSGTRISKYENILITAVFPIISFENMLNKLIENLDFSQY